MKVRIKLFATLREKYGKKELAVDAEDFRDVFYKASEVLGKEFLKEVFQNRELKEFRDDRIITINGRNIKDIKDEIRIKEGDVIAVFPPVAGG
ncbi:MAG: molybdopterin synthase sulfur carrier subunit [Archaeoglobales archaeon]|nr:MAG: molybdopterin synthase sulfur carrier subunit [Archaeoglobales archaeon]